MAQDKVRVIGLDAGYSDIKRGGEDKSALMAALEFSPGRAPQKPTGSAAESKSRAEPYYRKFDKRR